MRMKLTSVRAVLLTALIMKIALFSGVTPGSVVYLYQTRRGYVQDNNILQS
jgi:hypothetical protein